MPTTSHYLEEAPVLEMHMDIHFCDLCNESVPQSDLDRGLAFLRNGRVVCARCDRAMSGERMPGPPLPGEAAPAGDPRSAAVHGAGQGTPVESGGAGGVLVGLVALVFAAGGFALLVDRVDRFGATLELAQVETGDRVSRLERAQASLAEDVDGRLGEHAASASSARDADRRELTGALEGLRAELARSSAGSERLAGELADLRTDVASLGRGATARHEEVSARVARLEEEQRFLGERLMALEESVVALSSRPAGPAGSYGANVEGGPGPWATHLPDLADENPGVRLEAIYALGETGDPGVVAYLVPMLRDGDLFVRMATARILQDLAARPAVPALIDALEDSQSAVREAAMVALRSITGREFRYEPLASEAERAKRVKAWRDWWERSGSDFLAGN